MNQDLFPSVGMYKNYSEKHSYIKSVLVELAKNNQLYLTSVRKQINEEARQIAADVLCGVVIEEQQQKNDHYPLVLENYKVKLQRLGDKPLKYKDGQKTVGQRKGVLLKQPILVEIPFDAEGVVEVGVKTAMKILGQWGKNYKTAISQHSQMRNWKVEELPPANYSASNEPKKSRLETLVEQLGGEENLELLIEQLSKKTKKVSK